MSVVTIFQVLIAFGALQALFLAGILLSQRQQGWPKRFFALFLLIEGITLVERLLAETGLIESVPHLVGVSMPISFIKLPMLFLAVCALVNNRFHLRWVHAWHLSAFVLMLLMMMPVYFQSAEAKLAFVQEFVTRRLSYSQADFYISLSFFAYSAGYVWAIMRQLHRFRKHVRGNALVNFLWKVMVLFSVFLGSHFIYFVLEPSGLIYISTFSTISMLIMSFLIQSVAYSFIRGADPFTQKSNVDLERIEQFLGDEKQLLQALDEEKVYLNDGLSIDELAASLGWSKKQLSELINHRFGCTFTELINRYRVEEAKTIMEAKAATDLQLKEVAFDSGFNNKVSFYRTFKRHTGQAPSDYLAELRQQMSSKQAAG